MPESGFLNKLFHGIRNKDGKSFAEVLEEKLPGDTVDEIKRGAESELQKPPKIALIGKTGVGKSSTINALFGTDLPVSHVEACTQVEAEVSFNARQLEGRAGTIIVYDMPGLGEDLDADEQHKITYARVLEQCDVAVWVLAAAGPARAMAYDQMMIKEVVNEANPGVGARLVVGLNQVDVIQPGSWVEKANVPSRTQKASIERRVEDIQSKLQKVTPSLTQDRIVPYSATRRYRLAQLFEAMLSACDRAWVLESRQAMKDFRELVDPELLRLAEERRQSEKH